MTARVTVRVQPGARRAGLLGRLASGEWKVAVTAPPEGGRANEAVTRVLAAALGLKARQLQVARGATSRSKVFAVEGLDDAEAARRLASATAGSGDGQ